ncbi:hypothetical protein CDL15_Pgr006921 [Punica granatum]|uniref:Uncharacterized protein n=1 Tax=Punica granatum TaxID=22663 RepID=A0A218X853_PUNGR|nr:hypothetical protein CDL15_Pgr006921 [Punica granatum]
MAQVQMAQVQVPNSHLELVLVVAATAATTQSYLTHSRQSHPLSIVLLARSSVTTYINSVLARFHAGYFRITLSLAAQSLLLKTMIDHPEPQTTIDDGTGKGAEYPLHRLLVRVHPTIFLLMLWSLTLATLTSLSLIYFLRCVFRFELVKAEFLNRVGVNYLFTPWISWLLLLQSAPFVKPGTVPCHILWWVFVAPVVALDVKIYGQWFIKGKSGTVGLGGKRTVPIFARDGALLGALRNPLPAVIGRRIPPPDAEADFLSVVCSPKHGELGLGVHSK